MKLFIGTLIAVLTMMTSRASTILTTDGDHNPYVTQHQIVTLNALARVKPKKIVRYKVVNLKVHRFPAVDDDEDIFVQEEDLATGYRRRDLTKIEHSDGVSDYVRWRLFLARQMAMLKYREVHS